MTRRCERNYTMKEWPYTRRCKGEATHYAHVPTGNPNNPKETETLIVCEPCAHDAADQGIATGTMGP